jgi:hypothetical protein
MAKCPRSEPDFHHPVIPNNIAKMNIASTVRSAARRASHLLLAGLMLLPEALPLSRMTVGVATSAAVLLFTGEAEARYGTVRRVVRRTGRRVAYLGAGASLVYLGGVPCYYWDGGYYQREGDVYIEIEVEVDD